MEERTKARENASHVLCAEGLDTPRGCAPVNKTHPKEKTPMKTAAGPKRTTRHFDWGTSAVIRV